MNNKALFIDRDGIFNELVTRDGGFHSPRNWQEVKHYPLDGLDRVKSLGYKLIMITNQPDIERGIIVQSFIDELHSYYQKEYSLDKCYVCPFASNEHPLKKPNPGMFFLAQKDFEIDFSKSYFLGDTDRDVDAAKRCGISPILWTRDYNRDLKSRFRVTSLSEVMEILSTPPLPLK